MNENTSEKVLRNTLYGQKSPNNFDFGRFLQYLGEIRDEFVWNLGNIKKMSHLIFLSEGLVTRAIRRQKQIE